MIKILKSLDSKVNFKKSICKIKSNQPLNLKFPMNSLEK